VFDDFTDSQLSLQEFCQLTDPYPRLLNVKFGSTGLKAREFIFTSNVDPTYWWNTRDAEEALPQVHRRINHVIHLEKTTAGEFKSVTFTPCPQCSGWDNVSASPVEQVDNEIFSLLDALEQERVDDKIKDKDVIDLTN